MLLHPGPAALHRASSAAGMPLSPGEVPWAWGRPVTVSSATLSPKAAPHYSPAMHSSGHIVCEGCYPLENSPPTGNTRLQTRGAPFPPGEWGLPTSDTPSLPPTHSQPVWGVHSLPRGTSPTTHPCVRASFPSAHKHCVEFMVKSYPAQARAQFWTAQLHRSTDATFVTAPPLHLTRAGCPWEWLSTPAQPCSLLRFSHMRLEEAQPP